MIVCPFTRLHPATKHVLDGYGLPVRYEDVSGDADAYRRLLAGLWERGETFVLVEHDIIPWPGAIEEMLLCCGLWCGYAYQPYGVYHALGCAKISAGFIAKLPGLWDHPVVWNRLDAHLLHTARYIGEEPHGHRPPVTHLKSS